MAQCLKIGEKNKKGIKKTYSCSEYAKIDKNFISEYWCEVCTNKLIDPLHYVKLEERRKLEREEDNLHKR